MSAGNADMFPLPPRAAYPTLAGGAHPPEMESLAQPSTPAAAAGAAAPMRHRRWSASEDATLVGMYRHGATLQEIGFALQRTAAGARVRLSVLRRRRRAERQAETAEDAARRAEWVATRERLPGVAEVCDWLFHPDDEKPQTWMLCHESMLTASVPGQAAYWRPARPVPRFPRELP